MVEILEVSEDGLKRQMKKLGLRWQRWQRGQVADNADRHVRRPPSSPAGPQRAGTELALSKGCSLLKEIW